jgi:hypothetical protein
MLVIFRPDKCVPPINASKYFDRVKLNEGVNDSLTEDELKSLQGHDAFEQHVKWGAIEVKEDITPGIVDPAVNSDVSDLSEYNEDDAADIIRETLDKDTLVRWLAIETRKGVRAIINARIKAL